MHHRSQQETKWHRSCAECEVHEGNGEAHQEAEIRRLFAQRDQ